jgi:hypothetical protein
VDTFQKQVAAILQTASNSWDSNSVRETYIGAEFNGINKGEDDDEYSLPAEEHDQLHIMVDWPDNV